MKGLLYPSICSVAWRERPLDDAIAAAAKAGYAGVELWGPHLDAVYAQEGDLSRIASMLEQRGLETPMISPYWHIAAEPEEALQSASRHIRYAQALGCPLIRGFCGGGDSAEASQAVWEATVAGLTAICEMAARAGIGIALETHGGHLHDSTDSTLRLIEAVDRPNLGVNLDIYNQFERGEEPLWALEQLRGHLRILHFKNRSGEEHVRIDRGDMPYRPFLQALLDGGYQGYASIEWFGPDPDNAAGEGMAALREMVGDRLRGGDDASV